MLYVVHVLHICQKKPPKKNQLEFDNTSLFQISGDLKLELWIYFARACGKKYSTVIWWDQNRTFKSQTWQNVLHKAKKVAHKRQQFCGIIIITKSKQPMLDCWYAGQSRATTLAVYGQWITAAIKHCGKHEPHVGSQHLNMTSIEGQLRIVFIVSTCCVGHNQTPKWHVGYNNYHWLW